ncbi:hypothetical protein O181_012782 [Austropuccinia psidii MF-1]|uniref:Reverse transcriptase domain-containing protein n=1 Tax=Austropuccinia psidii MF-1 TaxID=1389203 RepID=A0A9Q3GNC0_9BASI|nr:hypothetical protein [Austropuccinia psidii MF-1]
MEDLSILNINDQLRILKDHVLKIINNTNQFSTPLARGDSERQKLKIEINANVEQIHKNYKPHMPRNSTPFTEEKLSLKGSLTPFLGENPTCAKDLPKMEEWKTFSGEEEYNNIEFIRTIDMLQNNFHIPDEIIVGNVYLKAILPGWKDHLLPIEGVKLSSAGNNMYPLGISDTNIVLAHPAGSVRRKTEIVVMDNCTYQHMILGNDYLNIYGVDINNHKDRYFTIGENKRQKFPFSNIPKKISIISSVKDTYEDEFVDNQLVEAQINPSLSPKMRHDLIDVLYTYNNALASDNERLVLRRPAYLASPRAREALEKHIQELIQLGVLRKVGHNDEVEVRPPVIIAWNNDESRMVGDLGALNTYKVPDRYPIPIIQETLTQLSKAKYITSTDALTGFHENILTHKPKKLLKTITHCGIYEYLGMPFGIKNSPCHYQRMMNTIFPTEFSEGWTIIYNDDIIICFDSWYLHLERLTRVLDKATGVNINISLKKLNLGFEDIKAIGHIVSGLSLGIDKKKVEEVLIKPIPQNNKEMMCFIGFATY